MSNVTLRRKQSKSSEELIFNGTNHRFLISVNVLGSTGPIRFVVNEDDAVAAVINTALKSYARQGRLPILGSEIDQFLLYCANGGADALSPWELIGSCGGRNFMLCKKQQTQTEAQGRQMREKTPGMVARKGSGSWKTWLNKFHYTLKQKKKKKKSSDEEQNVNGSINDRFLISINVLGSTGPIRFVVNEGDMIATVINTALKSYARQGRLPPLGFDSRQFLLYCSNLGADALSPSELIGSSGGRNFLMCKKQTEGDQAQMRATGPEVHAQKASGSWETIWLKVLPCMYVENQIRY